MKKIINPLFIIWLSVGSCMAQLNTTYSLAHVNPNEINEIIDSIWSEVVSWDGDSSLLIIQKREKYASDLENYFLEHQEKNTILDSPEGKALLYSFFIRFRNNEPARIIESFNNHFSDISTNLWHAIFPIYLKSLKRSKIDDEEWLLSLDIMAESDNNLFHKAVIWWDLGVHYYYIKADIPTGRKYFSKIIDMKSYFSKGVINDIITKAESILRQLDDLQLEAKAPNFCTKDINNNLICFNANQKQVVLLDFWSTWCKPCIDELPVLKSIYEKYKNRRDFQMISVSLDKDIDILQNFIAEQNMEWSQIFEGGDEMKKGKVTLLYNGVALPTYFVIGKDGLIYYNFDSRLNGLDLEEVLEMLMVK